MHPQDGWGSQGTGHSSEGADTAITSDSGREHIRMSDMQPMSDAQASERVFM